MIDNDSFFLMRSTGFADKSGRTVHEGDIVKIFFSLLQSNLPDSPDAVPDKDGRYFVLASIGFRDGAFRFSILDPAEEEESEYRLGEFDLSGYMFAESIFRADVASSSLVVGNVFAE